MQRAVDITGDESIMMVSLPGHTDGHAGFIVRNVKSGRFVLIAGDAAFSRRNWEDMTPPGFSADAELHRRTLGWIANAAAGPDCAAVLCSHDAEGENEIIF